MQSLPHFSTTVIHQYRTVGIDVYQRTGLVEMYQVEGDAEFDRCQRNALTQYRAVMVELANRRTTRGIVTTGLNLCHQFVNDIIIEFLSIRSDITVLLAIKIEFTYFERILTELARDVIDNLFNRERALGTAKTAEGGIRLGIGFRAECVDFDIV